jgi:hypothetical protein
MLRYDLLVGSTGMTICWILSASISESTSSLPVAKNSFKTFSVSLPARNVLCPSQIVNIALRMSTITQNKFRNKWKWAMHSTAEAQNNHGIAAKCRSANIQITGETTNIFALKFHQMTKSTARQMRKTKLLIVQKHTNTLVLKLVNDH